MSDAADWYLHNEKTGKALLRDKGVLIYDGLEKDMPDNIREIAKEFTVSFEEAGPILFGTKKPLYLNHNEAAFLLVLLSEEPTIQKRMEELQYPLHAIDLEKLTGTVRNLCWDFLQLPKNDKLPNAQ